MDNFTLGLIFLGIGFFFLFLGIAEYRRASKEREQIQKKNADMDKITASISDVKQEIKKSVYDYTFPSLLKERYMKERNKTEEEYYLVQLALKDWFSIFAFNTNRTQFYDFPSKEVDELWHLFILFTKDYREFCQEYLGQFLDHVPLKSNDKDKTNLNNLLATFRGVQNKNDALLFRIDDKFGINNKYNYSFMKRINESYNKPAKSRSKDDAVELYQYSLISYSDTSAMDVKPSYSSSSSSKSSCGSSCGSSSSSSCGSSCGSGGGCGS